MTSVPSRRPVSSAGEHARASPTARGSAPRRGRPAGSGSGGPSARCPAKPASSAASATPRSHAGRVLAPREPRDLEHAPRGRPLAAPAAAAAGRRGRRRGRRRVAPTTVRRGPSPRRRARRATVRGRAQLAGRARAAGTGRSRAALRARHSRRGGVEARRRRRAGRAARASVEPARDAVPGRGPGCRRRWSARGAAGPATIRSSSANASAEASRSCRPLPTTPRRASEETISAAR